MKQTDYTDLVDVLNRSVVAHDQRRLFGTKIDGTWQWITYGEFGKRVDAFRGALAGLGIGQGDTVAVISANRVEWAIGAYATYGLGARYCPMYESQLEKDWRYITEDSGAKVLIVATYPIYEATRDWPSEGVGALEHVYCMSLPSEDEASFAALEKQGEANPTPAVEIDPSWVCGFIYTSGTTGKPKGVLLTHSNITSNLNGVSAIFPVDTSDISVSFLPWAHSFGQTCELHSMLARGAAIALAESIEKLVDNFAEVRPTVLFSVPRIFNKIYDGLQKKMAEEGGLKQKLFESGMANAQVRKELAEAGKSSWWVDTKHGFYDKLVFSKVRDRFGGRLRYASSGGAALSPEVGDFIDKLGIMVCEGYGLTETSPIATTNHPTARRLGSVGRAIPGVEIIIDSSMVEDKDSGDGEIIVRGPNVMKGYHNRPEATAEVINEDGSFRTGDLGRLDKDGFLYITGRIKEQYKLENGKYVVPAPLEELLQLSPYITQAFIHGFNKPFNVALLVPDQLALEKWAAGQGIGSDYQAILDHPKTQQLFTDQVAEYSKDFKRYEQPRKFKLLSEEFSVDNGMLTPKMSLKRNVVMDHYGDDIEALHA
ncbi:MAG: long-chain fatty acid--CoA ligase [Acidobacteriota bacterium]